MYTAKFKIVFYSIYTVRLSEVRSFIKKMGLIGDLLNDLPFFAVL